ncbi:EndoU domain-containing protein [Candidatus Dependentiae bacterium]|nr:EndoU domain-containing protein [Candidatus Dependentiae bacterium]
MSDCIFQHKALQIFGAVAGVLRSQVRTMKTMEFVQNVIGHEFASIGVSEKIAQVTEELEIVVQKSAVDEILKLNAKSENVACKNSIQSSVYDLSEELALITKQNITQKIENIMKPSLSEVKELAVKYSKISTEIEGVLQDMLIDIEHIFIPEVKPRWKYDPIAQKRTLDEFFISGWHHGYLEQFEQIGLFKVIKKVVKNDRIYVEYSWDYGKKIMKKTLFPDHWTKQQIIEKMTEIIKKPVSCIDNNIGDRLEKTFLGVTSEGIEIELVLKKELSQKSWQLATGFVSKDYILKG